MDTCKIAVVKFNNIPLFQSTLLLKTLISVMTFNPHHKYISCLLNAILINTMRCPLESKHFFTFCSYKDEGLLL